MTDSADLPQTLGLAEITRMAFRKDDPVPLLDRLLARIGRDPDDAGALMDLSMLLATQGRAADSHDMRTRALGLSRSYVTTHGNGSGPSLLSLAAPGDFMANTPVDFLLTGSDARLITRYVGDEDDLATLPPHDAAFLAVGEAPEHRAMLGRLAAALPALPHPPLNGAPDRIAGLTRDGVARLLADLPGVLCPPTLRLDRAALTTLATGMAPSTLHPGLDWPLVLRPVGTHAGEGMEKLHGPGQLARLLDDEPAEAFYLAPFIDYRGQDGLFAKARAVLIGGRPYPVHLALSSHWIVHYLSAEMVEKPARRAAEAAWFETFDAPNASGFAHRHGPALAAIQERLGLDYWGLDCAEMPDGRLLVFEIDTALIVHDMDDPQTFPYKPPAMRCLFAGFQALAFGS